MMCVVFASPEYVLLISDIGGERRFASAVARRKHWAHLQRVRCFKCVFMYMMCVCVLLCVCICVYVCMIIISHRAEATLTYKGFVF